MGWVAGRLAAAAGVLARGTERWIPDAWVICLILTLLALALAVLGAGASVEQAVLAWGGGVWGLLALAMQFTIAMVAAHACVASPRAFAALDRLAALPDRARPAQAVLLTGVFSLVTAYLNWALCLVACALFVPFVCRRNPAVDVRVVVAAASLGLGTVWHGGLSGSAPLILATPGNPLLAPASGAPLVARVIPVTETLFSPWNLAYVAAIGAVGLLVVMALHPRRGAITLSPEQVEAMLPRPPEAPPAAATPAARIDAFPGWLLFAAVLLLWPLGHAIVSKGFGRAWTIDAYNATFLALALLLHRSPVGFLRACRAGVDHAWGIVLQFPFYAGIVGIMAGTGLGTWIGHGFVELASPRTFPFLVYAYSAVVNLFVPSGGSKWLIEAPYLLPAGEALGVSATTTLLAYCYGDSTTNLIQPFFAIPVLAVTKLRFGDVLGHTTLVAAACFAVTALAMLVIPLSL
jgi:short-chain fatty acids transporter